MLADLFTILKYLDSNLHDSPTAHARQEIRWRVGEHDHLSVMKEPTRTLDVNHRVAKRCSIVSGNTVGGPHSRERQRLADELRVQKQLRNMPRDAGAPKLPPQFQSHRWGSIHNVLRLAR